MPGHVSRPWSPKICTLARVGLVSKISGLTGRLHKPKISESRLSARKTQETNVNRKLISQSLSKKAGETALRFTLDELQDTKNKPKTKLLRMECKEHHVVQTGGVGMMDRIYQHQSVFC